MNKEKIDFSVFVSGLMAEGLAAMGLFSHESAAGIKKDLRHADMVIETLGMLKEKTAGNLSADENRSLDEVLHQLRMAYVAVIEQGKEAEIKEKSQNGKPGDPGE